MLSAQRTVNFFNKGTVLLLSSVLLGQDHPDGLPSPTYKVPCRLQVILVPGEEKENDTEKIALLRIPNVPSIGSQQAFTLHEALVRTKEQLKFT